MTKLNLHILLFLLMSLQILTTSFSEARVKKINKKVNIINDGFVRGYSKNTKNLIVDQYIVAKQGRGRTLNANSIGLYYISTFKCNGKNLVFFDDRFLKTTTLDEMEAKDCGSAGCMTYLFYYDKKYPKVLTPAFDFQIIDFLGAKKFGNCPEIQIVLHGSDFDRVGNDYGIATVEFVNGKYQIRKKDEKIVEVKGTK